MNEKFSRLTENNRCEINCLLKQGLSYRKIAKHLGVSVSTISNEVRLGKTKSSWQMQHGKDVRYALINYWHVYNPHYANAKAKIRKANAGRKIKLKQDYKLFNRE
jgi:IS30 family transposase